MRVPHQARRRRERRAGLAFALDAVEVRRSLDGAILPLSTRRKEAIAQHDLAA